MGTRGFVGFQSDDKETITYNQYDMYPSGCGVGVLEFVRVIARDPHLEEAYKAKAASLKQVNQDTPPTRDEIVELISHSNLNVSTRDAGEWYVLLRETHGVPSAILDCGYAEHMPEWPIDSLFCEWGYLIDFDRRVLEVYEGFQTTPPTAGRWTSVRPEQRGELSSGDTYYPVKLVAEFAFDDLPTNDEFVAKLEPNEENE